MAKKVTFECDTKYCFHTRTPTNHWFLLRGVISSLGETKSIIILPFKEEDLIDGDEMYCGESCLSRRVSDLSSELHAGPAFVPTQIEKIGA
jgi:hypothetical protein